jgi:hypothetical protein
MADFFEAVGTFFGALFALLAAIPQLIWLLLASAFVIIVIAAIARQL